MKRILIKFCEFVMFICLFFYLDLKVEWVYYFRNYSVWRIMVFSKRLRE